MTILIDDSSLTYGPSANLEVHPTAQQLGGHGSPRFGVGWARTTVRTITVSVVTVPARASQKVQYKGWRSASTSYLAPTVSRPSTPGLRVRHPVRLGRAASEAEYKG